MRYFAIAFLVYFAMTPAFAAGCYSPAQFRAEQAVKFHTQLMIVGMRCQNALSATAYQDYKAFTLRNQTVIRKQENELVGFYKKQGKGERGFHTFRTKLANDISMQANGPSFQAFCRSYAEQLKQAKAMGPKDFSAWIEKLNVKQATGTYPLCSAASAGQ